MPSNRSFSSRCTAIATALFLLLLLPAPTLAQDATTTTSTSASTDSTTDSSTSTSATDSTASSSTTDSTASSSATDSTASSSTTDSTTGTSSVASTTSSSTTVALPSPTRDVTTDCLCGFQDPLTNDVWTDSLILYFNETNTAVPTDQFSIDTFAHPYEKGWTIYYREGAVAENVFYTYNSSWNIGPSWLTMNISAATPEHLVNGAQLQTVRQDIQYGSFRVLMQSPSWGGGGSAMTMRIEHNETISAELDLQNMADSQDDACVQTTTGGQEPLLIDGLNYTDLDSATLNPNNRFFPWLFYDYRMDWTESEIDWYTGNYNYTNKTRSMPTVNASMVDTPSAFYLKHWSNGDVDWMQGPPTNSCSAAVGYVRLFFNSSLTSESQLLASDSSCNATAFCSTDDWTLRGSTPYTPAMTSRELVRLAAPTRNHSVGIFLIVASLAFSAALIIHAVVRKVSGRRAPTRALAVALRRPKMPTSPMPSESKVRPESQAWLTAASRPVSEAWTTQTDYEMETLRPMAAASSTTLLNDDAGHRGPYGRSMSGRPLLQSAATSSTTLNAHDRNSPYGSLANRMEASTADLLQKSAAAVRDVVPEGSQAAANPGAKPTPLPAGVPQARTRVDYLAGLVAVCSLLVSCTHFILTFVPSVIEEILPQHYESEYWARRTIEPFLFNEVWVGIFFTTSTRFLCSGYLRTGNLKTIAEKVVCRCPRLMIPITAVILFQYFLMDLGAVTYLEYIPSITWSTWPSTTLYTNFGYFIDETLQLFYLIPNGAPQLTWNYCTGVLWTIPVQLQNSWLVLLGVVIIREIKTPWKRFCYYGFCIINHWYAMSWGSYFWFGLLLADLDITYKYRKPIQANPLLHYPLLILACILVFVSLGNDLLSVWTGYTFSIGERGIHPDPSTDLPIAQTALAGYPNYIEPKLNGLVFAVAAQYVVELSTWVQAVLSTKVFLWLFPHVFTIYLIHGLIFWSIGSLVCVYFAGIGLAFWLNILLTALICYVTLFACVPIVTPVMEMLGKEITKGIWVSASEEPAPHHPTSHPLTMNEVRDMMRRKEDE